MEHQGNGYIGHSMSVNAKEAYDDGRMPLSAWGKYDIIEKVGDLYGEDAAKHCEALTAKELKDSLLVSGSEYHHTGKFFAETVFYHVNEGLSKESVMSLQHKKTERKKKDPISVVWGLVVVECWEGRFKNYQKKVIHYDVAWWNEKDGLPVGMAHCVNQGDKRNFYVSKKLNGKPRKNAKIWKEVC